MPFLLRICWSVSVAASQSFILDVSCRSSCFEGRESVFIRRTEDKMLETKVFIYKKEKKKREVQEID